MSSEDYASNGDAQSSPSDNVVPLPTSDSDRDSPRRSKQGAATSIFLRSESLFLALLFAVVALLLPTFFFFASDPSNVGDSEKKNETNKSPLTALLPYIPAFSTVLRFSFSTFHLLSRPFITVLSFILTVFAPVVLALNILLQVLVILPSRLVVGLARFFYPVYVFCGVACLFGAGVGLCGRLVVEGSRLITFDTRNDINNTKRRKS